MGVTSSTLYAASMSGSGGKLKRYNNTPDIQNIIGSMESMEEGKYAVLGDVDELVHVTPSSSPSSSSSVSNGRTVSTLRSTNGINSDVAPHTPSTSSHEDSLVDSLLASAVQLGVANRGLRTFGTMQVATSPLAAAPTRINNRPTDGAEAERGTVSFLVHLANAIPPATLASSLSSSPDSVPRRRPQSRQSLTPAETLRMRTHNEAVAATVRETLAMEIPATSAHVTVEVLGSTGSMLRVDVAPVPSSSTHRTFTSTDSAFSSSSSSSSSSFSSTSSTQSVPQFVTDIRGWLTVRALARIPAVTWVERLAKHKTMNKFASFVTQSDLQFKLPLWDHGLTGLGQVAAVADTGVDHDSCYFADPNRDTPLNRYDPAHRKIVAYLTSMRLSNPDRVGGDQVDGHGTHTSGTVAGIPVTGSPDLLFQYKGLAYNSKLVVFDYQSPTAAPDDMVLPEDIYDDYLQRAYGLFGVRVTSNSWGDQTGMYDSFARAVDQFTWDHPDFLNVFACGNTGTIGKLTIASPALAKNVVAVGSTLNSPLSFFERGVDAGIKVVIATPAPSSRVAAGTAGLSTNATDTSTDLQDHIIEAVPATFGIPFAKMEEIESLQIIVASPLDACAPITLPASSTAVVDASPLPFGIIATRGACSFTEKAANAQAVGATLIIIVNNSDEPSDVMSATSTVAAGSGRRRYADISAVMVQRKPGQRIIDLAGNVRLGRGAPSKAGVFVHVPVPMVLEAHNEFRLSSFSSRGMLLV